ncbi:MAG TPA: CRISPR-associated endonuclease Cas1 [Syntrophomonadaceae bacterium]|nr:CRISPR-associated endonuclease Cas1 [Syntrophomonadaceae bacterium]
MSILYIYERAAKVGVQENCIVVESNNLKRTIPIEGVENVIIFGDASLSSSCVRQFMERNINLTWLSTNGKFYGRLESTRNVNVNLQRNQFLSGEDEEFCLNLAKKFISAKVKNQITVLRRYKRNRPDTLLQDNIEAMLRNVPLIEKAIGKNQLMGHEGIAARNYYQGLGQIVEEEFKFKGRNRQPPRDPFNSLLSFAYTLLMYDVYTAVVNKGLSPYASFLHSIRQGHPALCSDLMEEWRPVLADSLALYVTSKSIINESDFQKPNHEGGVYLDSKASKLYIAEYEKKIRSRANYLSYADYSVSFRRAVEMQCHRLGRAIEEKDPDIYEPVVIR